MTRVTRERGNMGKRIRENENTSMSVIERVAMIVRGREDEKECVREMRVTKERTREKMGKKIRNRERERERRKNKKAKSVCSWEIKT